MNPKKSTWTPEQRRQNCWEIAKETHIFLVNYPADKFAEQSKEDIFDDLLDGLSTKLVEYGYAPREEVFFAEESPTDSFVDHFYADLALQLTYLLLQDPLAFDVLMAHTWEREGHELLSSMMELLHHNNLIVR